jgi:phage shock protein C
MVKKKLCRSKKDRIIGGVCGGIAEYLKTDPTIIRILWVLGSLAWGAGILAYLLFWIIIPEK